MDNKDLANAVCAVSAFAAHSAEDESLLSRYSAQLCAEEIAWRTRQLMLGSAKQFLHWWRKQYVGHESAWSHLREVYLRHTCPDRELRQEERAWLNRFLRFIDATS